jgi:NADPH-dependent curcumin reductase CurA
MTPGLQYVAAASGHVLQPSLQAASYKACHVVLCH